MIAEAYRPINLTQQEARLAYNPRLELEAVKKLNSLRSSLTREKFKAEQQKLLDLTRTNLITSLAERLNVEIYRTNYIQKGNKLYHSEFYKDTPFSQIVREGQQTRESAGSVEVIREKAEVEGFEKVEELFTNNLLSNDAKVIMISPKGSGSSIYGHNFFDLYQKNPEGKITMSRYSSNSTKSEFKQAADILDNFNGIPNIPTDADFLRNPIVTYMEINEVLNQLNLDSSTMTHEEFEEIIPQLEPQIENFKQALQNNANTFELQKLYHSLVKSSDILAGRDNQYSADEFTVIGLMSSGSMASEFFAHQPIREVRTGCGISGSNLGPYSVSEFKTGAITPFSKSNEDQYGTLEIHCEECGSRYNRTPGKLEPCCKNCGGTKGIAC